MNQAIRTATPRLHRLDTWRGVCLCATIVLCATAYSFRLTSFLHAKETVLQLGTVGMACLLAARGQGFGPAFRAYCPLWGGLGVAVGSGLLLAQVPALVWEEGIRCAALLLAALLAFDLQDNAIWRGRIFDALLASAVAVGLLGILQYAGLIPFCLPPVEGYDQRAYSVFGNQDLFGGYLAIALPLLIHRLPRNPLAGYPALAVILTALVLSGSRSAWLAAAAGILIGFPYSKADLRRWRLPGALAAVALAIAVALTWPQTSARVRNTLSPQDAGGRIRLWIWDGTRRMIRDQPLFGVGLGNYRYWSPRYLGEALHAPGGERHRHNELHTIHAHCEPLECWAETGIVGTAFGLWMLLRLLRRRGPAWGALAALLVFSLFNAAWHSAPHALAGLLLAGTLLHHSSDTGDRLPGRRGWGALAFSASVFLVAFGGGTTLVPSYYLRAAEDVHLAGGPAVPYYQRVFAHGWPNATAQEECGMALLDAGRTREAYDRFLRALPGLDTGRLYQLLGVTAAQLEEYQTARQWLWDCLWRWPGNQRAWDLLGTITPAAERPPWIQHGRRWRLTAPGEPRPTPGPTP